MLVCPGENERIREFKSVLYDFYFMIRTMDKIFEEEISRLAGQMGLSHPQYMVLLIACHQPGIKVSEIARVGSWHISTVMSLINGLKTKGLLRLEVCQNGRGSGVLVTEQGHQVACGQIDAPPEYFVKLIRAMGCEGIKSMNTIFREALAPINKQQLDQVKDYLEIAREKIVCE